MFCCSIEYDKHVFKLKMMVFLTNSYCEYKNEIFNLIEVTNLFFDEILNVIVVSIEFYGN